MWASWPQQGGPSVLMASLVSGSWEREVILRGLGRVSEHANKSLCLGQKSRTSGTATSSLYTLSPQFQA